MRCRGLGMGVVVGGEGCWGGTLNVPRYKNENKEKAYVRIGGLGWLGD